MKRYMLAEFLKMKHSFLKILLVLMPLVATIQSFILSQSYIITNSYNWWTVILLPATTALIMAMIHQKEQKKLKYRAVYPLPIDLNKLWLSKVFIALIFLTISSLIHLISAYVTPFIAGPQLIPVEYSVSTLLLATFLLIWTNLWQLPWCLFLARKIGFIASVIVHTVLSVIGIFFADTSFWLIYPYSWGARLLVPVMHLLPNGLYATANNPMLTNTSVIIPSVLSVVYFIGLNVFLSKWFSKLEVI